MAPCFKEGLAIRSLVLDDGSILADDESMEQQGIVSGTVLVAYVVDRNMFVGTYKYLEDYDLGQLLELREDGRGQFSSTARLGTDDGGDSTYVRKGAWTFTGQLITLACDHVDATFEDCDAESKEENWIATFNVNYEGDGFTLET